MFTKTLLDSHFWKKKRSPPLLARRSVEETSSACAGSAAAGSATRTGTSTRPANGNGARSLSPASSCQLWRPVQQEFTFPEQWGRRLLSEVTSDDSVTVHSATSCSGSSAGSCGCPLTEGSDERSPPERPDTLYHLALYHQLFYRNMWVSTKGSGNSPAHCLAQGTHVVC